MANFLIDKEGTGTQTLSGDVTINSVNGGVFVTEGTLVLSGSNILPVANVISGARLRLESDQAAGGNEIKVSALGSSSPTVSFGNGVTNSTPIVVGGPFSSGHVQLEVLDGETAEHSGAINEQFGGGSVVKTGTGRLILSGNSTYTDLTTVAEGTLLVSGSIAASSGVIVQSGAVLGGTGTVAGTVVEAGATLSPGMGGVGTLNVAGDIIFEDGSAFEVGVDPAATSSERVLVTGNATLNGGTVVHGARRQLSALLHLYNPDDERPSVRRVRGRDVGLRVP